MDRRNVKYEGPGWVVLRVCRGHPGQREATTLVLLLEWLDIPWVRHRPGFEDWGGWNGRALRLNATVSDVVHEVGHWLCANPQKRHLPDFGIDKDGSGYTPNGPAMYPDDEEAMASMLGILIERALGLPWADTFNFHNWRGRDCGGGVAQTVAMLTAAGLVRDMTPTCVLPVRALPPGGPDLARLSDALYSHDAGAFGVPLEDAR